MKKILVFFIQYKNEWKEHKFWRQKKKWLLQKQKSNEIDDIDVNKILVSKEEPYCTKIHLNTSLDTMIMMLFDHYA